jgi:hypothetical protein
MLPLPSLARLLALVVVGASLMAFAADDPERVGAVDKVEQQAEIVTGGNAAAARVGMPVHLRDELRTGPAARLDVSFGDGTKLTLGEKASVVVDHYIYDPKASVGETCCKRRVAHSALPPAASRR